MIVASLSRCRGHLLRGTIPRRTDAPTERSCGRADHASIADCSPTEKILGCDRADRFARARNLGAVDRARIVPRDSPVEVELTATVALAHGVLNMPLLRELVISRCLMVPMRSGDWTVVWSIET